ncbi:MAG: PAS domain S-box protein [Halodesulfurarchaeum sp.]
MGHRRRAERITSIIEAVSDPIIVLDSGGYVTEWNDASEELFGYSAPEARGGPLTDLLSLKRIDRRKIDSFLTDAESDSLDGSAQSVQITATRASGEERRVTVEKIEDDPTVVLAKPAKGAVEPSPEAGSFDVSIYRLAIERSTDLIAATDQNERLLFANERYRTFHALEDPVAGDSRSDVLPPDVYAEIKPEVERVLDGETAQFEMNRMGPDGTDHVFDIRYFPLETREGEIRGAVTTMREITELKRRAQSLRESWETYRDLVEGIPHPLILHEPGGDIIEVNEAACRFFECKEQDLLSKNLRELLVTNRAERPFDRLKRGDSDEEFFETECRTSSGAIVPVDVVATRVEYFGSESILTVARDISEQRAYERELERTNAGLEEFAAVVSQDLRNPLTVAKGWTEIAREGRTFEPLQQVSESLERMDHVIDYTLTLARKGEGFDRLSTIDLETLITNTWRAVETGTGTLQTDVGLSIRGDRGRLSHLFETLFENCTNLGESDGSFRVGELTVRQGFYVEREDVSLPDGVDSVESAHIGSGESVACDLVVVQRIATAHGWRMHLIDDESKGFRLEFSGVDSPEEE